MRRGPSNGGRVGYMKQLAKQDWQRRVKALATVPQGQSLLVHDITDGKIGRVPVDQVVAQAQAGGFAVHQKDGKLYVAAIKKAA